MELRVASIVEVLEKIADKCESQGMVREATELDIVANTLEREAGMMDFFKSIPGQAKELAKSLGVNLTPDKIIDVVKRYYDPKNLGGAEGMRTVGPEQFMKAAASMGTAKMMAALAAMLVSGFISQIEARGTPITIQSPFGEKTYSPKEIHQISKTDPKSFAIIMEQAQKQQSEGQQVAQTRQQTQEQSQKAQKPGDNMKQTKDTEMKSDAFGNQAKLVTFQDGSKQLEGDMLFGGKSLRTLMEQKGEIAKDPSAPRVDEQSHKIK